MVWFPPRPLRIPGVLSAKALVFMRLRREIGTVLSVVRLPLWCLLVAGFCVSAARAETLTLGGRTVILDPPAGYCALDPARPDEAAVIAFNEKMQQPRNHVVMQLADCGELADFRAGKRPSFERYGQYFVPVTDGAVKVVAGDTRTSMLAQAARELPQLDSGALIDAVTAKLRESAGGDVAGSHFLGVLKEDEAGIYLGITLGKMSVAGQTANAGAIGVVGLTLVNQIPVSLGLYQASVGAEAVPGLLAKVQQTLASIIQANAEIEAREGATPHVWYGIGLDALLVGTAVGLAVALFAWALSRWRSRNQPKS